MKKENFDELIASIKEAGEIKREIKKPSRIFVKNPSDIQEIRKNLNVTQLEFAHLLGVSINTIQNWEQGRRKPSGPARAFLSVAAFSPHTVSEALHCNSDKEMYAL